MGIKKRPNEKSMEVLRKIPGPGHYESKIELHYTNISGSKMGKDARKGHFLRTAGFTNPGPGSYKNEHSFVDRRSAPKFGFGSSTREKDYLGRSKMGTMSNTVGPGSYRIPVHVSKTAEFAMPNKKDQYRYVWV